MSSPDLASGRAAFLAQYTDFPAAKSKPEIISQPAKTREHFGKIELESQIIRIFIPKAHPYYYP
jgi:hypothetical protein